MAVYIGDKNITDVVAGNALDSAKQYADQGDANTLQQAKEYTDSEVSQVGTDYKQADATVLSEAKQYADQNMIPKSQKGQPGGLAELDETGRVPANQLPGFVDDVINVDTYNDLPNPGEDSKIYITIDTNLQYRWGGKSYVPLGSSLALGTTSQTAGRGDWTQAAYNHSLITNGSNPHGTTFASLPDAPTKLSQFQDDVVTGKYLPLTGGTMKGILICPNDSAYISHSNESGAALIQFAAGKTVIGSIDSQTYASTHIRSISGHVTVGTSTNGDVNTIWDSGNLNPVTLDDDQIITGWKRFTPKTKNGVYNTSGKVGTKDTYGTPFSWNVNSGGSIWNVQQESDLVTLIGVLNGRAIKLHSSLSESQITADKFNGIATKAIQDANGNYIDKTYISFNNTTAYTPTSEYNPATKGYVDSLAGTYILDMDNILAYISSSGSTPISQSNSQILQSIRLLILTNKMPRVFGKSTVEDGDILNVCSTCLSWQLTVGAPLKEIQGAVYMSFNCITGGYPNIYIRGTSIIVNPDSTLFGFEDSGWVKIRGSSTDIIATKIKDTANNTNKQIWTGTQAEYDAISTKDSNTIYFIVQI